MNRPLLALFTGLALTGAANAQTETWKIDPAHSAAQFAVRHMSISTVRGAFTKLAGTVQYDPADVSKTVLDVTIDTNSVDTRVEARDKDLRSEKYFDVQKFPTITFKSKHAEQAGAGKLKIAGNLTIHGVTKEAVLDVEGPTPAVKDAKGILHMGASATTSLDRTAFGMTNGQGVVGNDISITIDVELAKAPVGP
ncbi:MAG TPA: YceI family protein [Bryobacteraceae bacterium]